MTEEEAQKAIDEYLDVSAKFSFGIEKGFIIFDGWGSPVVNFNMIEKLNVHPESEIENEV